MTQGQGAQRYFFVHVMKTGGGSFRQQLRHNFAADEIYPCEDLDPDANEANWSVDYLTGLPAERLSRIRVFSGHFPFVVTRLLPVPVVTMTILRHPVERTISRLRHRQHHDPGSAPLSLEAIYDDAFFFPTLIKNHQAKVFAMSEDDKLQTFMDVLDVDDDRLELAKANLDSVDLLGLQEHHEEFLEQVQARYGWRIEPHHRRHGVPRTSTEVPKSFRRRIAEDNAADMAFYEYARGLYRERRRPWPGS